MQGKLLLAWKAKQAGWLLVQFQYIATFWEKRV